MNEIKTVIVIKKKFPFSFTKATDLSYSEEGEDIIIRKFFEKSYQGFYVDIGNFDKIYSNTYYFYKNGWKGLNIYSKPIETSITNLRNRDINIYKVIDVKPDNKLIHTIDDSSQNTIDDFVKNFDTSPLKTVKIETTTLNLIFKNQLPAKNGFLSDCVDIDILNIDVPGEELNIILSNNWKIFRPKIVLITDKDNLDQFNSDSPIYQNLRSHDYILFAKTSRTLIFRERNFLNESC